MSGRNKAETPQGLRPTDGLFPQRDTWRPLNPSFPTRISSCPETGPLPSGPPWPVVPLSSREPWPPGHVLGLLFLFHYFRPLWAPLRDCVFVRPYSAMLPPWFSPRHSAPHPGLSAELLTCLLTNAFLHPFICSSIHSFNKYLLPGEYSRVEITTAPVPMKLMTSHGETDNKQMQFIDRA